MLTLNQCQVQPIKDFRIDPVGFVLRNVNHSLARLFDYLVWLSDRCKEVFPSHATIARKLNVSTRWVRACVAKLVEYGFIETTFRQRNSSFFHLSSWFIHGYNRARLAHIFSSLRTKRGAKLYSGTYEQWKAERKQRGHWVSNYTCKNVVFNDPNKPKTLIPKRLPEPPQRLHYSDRPGVIEAFGESIQRHKENPNADQEDLIFDFYALSKGIQRER